MSIDTGDHKPIAKEPDTLSLKNYDWVRGELDKLLEAGVIREATPAGLHLLLFCQREIMVSTHV